MLIPASVGAVVVITLAFVALRVGTANLEAAENDRLAARQELVATTARGQASSQESAVMESLTKVMPFAPGAPELNLGLLRYLTRDGATDRSRPPERWRSRRRSATTEPCPTPS